MNATNKRVPGPAHGPCLALAGAVLALLLVPVLDSAAPAASAAVATASRIVYDSSSSPAGLWLMSADGTSPTSFKAGADGATFSADGAKMAYQVGGAVACNVNFGPGEIVAANADGSKPVTVGTGCSPRISPDGTRVLYIGPPVNGSPDPVYVANLSDPAHPKEILPFPNCVLWVVHAYPKYPNDQSVCNFDQLAAWVGNDTVVVSGYQNGLWELPATGGHPHPVLSGPDQDSDWYSGLSVSPNSEMIAGYPLSQSAQGNVLATVPAGGGALKILYSQGDSSVSYQYPQWLDNQTLVVQHASGTPARLISRIAVTSATAFSPKDINPADTTASFPALAPASGLKVFVKVLGSIRSGLAVDNDYPDGGPVNFTVPTYGGQHGSVYTGPFDEGQKCESGCVNLLVTVVDSLTHKPVTGATVTASLGPIANLGAGALADVPNDNEFLCLQSDKAPGVPQSPCGADLPDLTTDKQGHVHLVYWAPGLVATARTTLSVSAAEQTCAQGACSLKGGTAGPTALVVRPYLIYQGTGVLPAKEAGLLVELAQEPNLFVADLAADQYAHNLIEQALTTLDLFEEHAATIAGTAGLVVSTTAHAVEAFSKYGEQLGLIATLLEAEHLSTLGLGEEPNATTVPRDASPYFTGHILSGLGNVRVPGLPSAAGPSGILWTDAQALSRAQKRVGTVFATRPEKIDLKVYEVSHCDEGYSVCGPGYKHLPAQSSAAIENHFGVQAQLCFYFSGSGTFPGFKWDDHFCENQYAPLYWVAAQPGTNRALP
jgi:hypothetical protein